MEIEKILLEPEGKTLEFKRDLSSIQPIIRTIVAFANTAGGLLIIGRDEEGIICGIEDVLDAEQRLANTIADTIYPQIMPEIEIITIRNKSLLVVRVAHWRGPFYVKNKGLKEGTYIRLGSTNRVASGELLEELQRSISKVSFDQLPCPAVDRSGLDMQRIQAAFSKAGKKIDENKLQTLGILVPFGSSLVCSNGGIILFGQDHIRTRYFPNSFVRCARFSGTEKVEFIDQYDVEGTIIEAVDEVTKFIRRNTRLAAKIERIRREDIAEYPPVAIREVLINALVHADYSIGGMNPRIAIFADRLEIESPGMLPFGYTLDDFKAGMSHIRNKVIARVFRELHMMEEWGTGYKRIHEACLKGNYETPVWREVTTAVQVTFHPHAITQDRDINKSHKKSDDLFPRSDEILKILQHKRKLTTKQICAFLSTKVSERTIRLDLAELKEKGILVKVGRGPSTYWMLAEDRLP